MTEGHGSRDRPAPRRRVCAPDAGGSPLAFLHLPPGGGGSRPGGGGSGHIHTVRSHGSSSPSPAACLRDRRHGGCCTVLVPVAGIGPAFILHQKGGRGESGIRQGDHRASRPHVPDQHGGLRCPRNHPAQLRAAVPEVRRGDTLGKEAAGARNPRYGSILRIPVLTDQKGRHLGDRSSRSGVLVRLTGMTGRSST